MNWGQLLSDKRLTRNKEKPNQVRNAFESDYGRLTFSPATRRMHDKTQVFPLTSNDNIHSRLTHSLEVMAIGHSLGIRIVESSKFQKEVNLPKEELLRTVPIILKNICLVHDIGNPPFGHFGETVIKEFFTELFSNSNSINFNLSKDKRKDFEKFDGNAQGFRILTKLQVLQDEFGLNLTCATLGSYLKYPNAGTIDENFLSKKKKGVFYSEKERFEEVIEECGMRTSKDKIARHPFAFLMEAADSICYLVMDIEDGYNKNWYTYEELRSYLKEHIKDKSTFDKIIKNSDNVSGENSKNTRIVRLRISLIDYLVDIAVENFVDNIDKILAGKYNKELIEDDDALVADTLDDFCKKRIFSQREIEHLELTGHSIINGLLTYYIEYIFNSNGAYANRASNLISRSIKHAACFEEGKKEFSELNPYYKLRVIVDFITGMTDQFALKHYQKLSGQKII